MADLTRETIIRDALFLVGESDNSYAGALKVKYDRTFDLIKRNLICEHQLPCTIHNDVALNTAKGENDWYLLPADLCQFLTIPTGIRSSQVIVNQIINVRTEIRVVGGKLSYYGDLEYFETLPPPFINLLSLTFKENICLLVLETKPQLMQIFNHKIKEAKTELNSYKNTSQKSDASIQNIPHFSPNDTPVYGSGL